MKKIFDKTKIILPYFLLGIVVIGLLIFLDKRIDYLLDSDMSSEVMLAKQLSEENKLATENWFYSTEISVANTQIVYSFFFKFINDWHTVRMISYAVMFILMLAAYYYMCKQLKCDKYFALSAILLFLILSNGYFYIMLLGAYYIPYITIEFLTIGLLAHYINSEGKKKIVLGILMFITSLISGLSGPRQIVITHLPIFLAGIILLIKNRKTLKDFNIKNSIEYIKEHMDKDVWNYIIIASIAIIGAFIGYLINSEILSKLYYFKAWDNISYTGLNILKMNGIFNNFLYSYGYLKEDVLSIASISNLACFTLIGITIWSIYYGIKKQKIVKKEYNFFALISSISFFVFLMIYAFTNMECEIRHCIQFTVITIPLIAIFMANSKINYKKTIFSAILVLVTISCLYQCNNTWIKMDKTFEKREIVRVLLEKECYNGYATFWNANVLTELSDGKIEVWNWCDGSDKKTLERFKDIDQIYNWLQPTSHESNHPSGKVFILLTKEEYNIFGLKDKLDLKKVIYQSDTYILFGYENYEILKKETTENETIIENEEVVEDMVETD